MQLYRSRLMKVAVCSFLLGFLPTAVTLYLIAPRPGLVPGLLLVASAIGFFIALFACSHLERSLRESTLEINTSNKDPRLGLVHYLDETHQILTSLRYQVAHRDNDVFTYEPYARLKILSGPLQVVKSPYDLVITGPHGTLKILASQLGLKKIYL